MMPISEIHEGDIFQNPLFPGGVLFYAEKVNIKEKMILIQPHYCKTGMAFGKPFWKKNTDRMFSESWKWDV